LKKAIEDKKRMIPFKIPIYSEGKEKTTEEVLLHKNPSQFKEVISQVSLSNPDIAEKAIQASQKAYSTWKKTSVDLRSDLLLKLANLINEKRYDLIATQVLEVGKPWAEADADIAEAIDFCRYYAADIKNIGKPKKVGGVPGEASFYSYKSRGVAVVIAPWNFPLAIITGMAAAALATGNTVILKPAEQSSLVAWELMKMIQQVGFPENVVQFLPGLGEVVGEYLVNHPLTTTIAFTGSKAVGLHILKKANTVQNSQVHVKKCIIEMGGKNAIIIDNDADLDEAVSGVLYSAFGFSGQKCSACSRAIVVEEVYDRFNQRLVEAVKSITQASAESPKSYLGPVIDQEAYERIQKTIMDSESKHKLLFKGQAIEGGYYIPPTIFSDVDPKSELALSEIFGPVLAIIKAKNLTEAITIANGTDYALTGGLFSRSPENIEQVKSEFEVGNLYINRGITGAMVDRHPFGGFKMSGVGSKTGGPDYLKQFLEPICITENTMRRGFAPVE
ncbi:MAG TPA: L-glutamate gamma-semialdehyde dehydrogenase, partial [Pseudobdellovibrionaceae bacterium]|nr:L-glutamate gamma-semialdehyde dehydrogenase [Pseudobdellovibrionaceae bacterium]